jgi:Predicted permease
VRIVFVLINIFLWVLVAGLGLTAAVRSKALFREGAAEGIRDFVMLLPRIIIGVVGSGYIAAVMPQDLITTWIGPESGILGIAIATLAGAITPGGAVVGFSVGAAALKGGGGAPQVIAYSTAWSLYSLTRLINWEVAMMPRRVVYLRAAVSLPLPFIAGIGALLLGKP